MILPAEVVHPDDPVGIGVLLLAGSSGRIDHGRAELLARHGATVRPLRWFGGPGLQPGPYEVPLELFADALDLLALECDRLAVIGTSFGAEAALLIAADDVRITATVAFAPTSVVWGGWDGDRETSHWTRAGHPVPYVPLVRDAWPTEQPPAFRDLYAASLAAHPAEVDEASLPVEKIRGELILVAGGDDQVWPSVDFAGRIARRRHDHDLETTVISHPTAGHRTVLPGEPIVRGGQTMLRGGTPGADAELGRRAWQHLTAALNLR
ncbi:acyl-CoA thioesterase [Microlunatus elymi]|uniref:Acyl-CoA thioesterase n=1 Tax=Microlunatus elymi TaxID=2596828 RepID=A0A516PYC8_9ACTN|nr:acyl-CoA thioester hydrolase/BAAT C-terminal domain-containing protein [Microlunatus elymi]QDP96178.1 acyl-CoA thioesterase [Microlunatus elymi]